jgi:hypothetical protein
MVIDVGVVLMMDRLPTARFRALNRDLISSPPSW